MTGLRPAISQIFLFFCAGDGWLLLRAQIWAVEPLFELLQRHLLTLFEL